MPRQSDVIDDIMTYVSTQFTAPSINDIKLYITKKHAVSRDDISKKTNQLVARQKIIKTTDPDRPGIAVYRIHDSEIAAMSSAITLDDAEIEEDLPGDELAEITAIEQPENNMIPDIYIDFERGLKLMSEAFKGLSAQLNPVNAPLPELLDALQFAISVATLAGNEQYRCALTKLADSLQLQA